MDRVFIFIQGPNPGGRGGTCLAGISKQLMNCIYKYVSVAQPVMLAPGPRVPGSFPDLGLLYVEFLYAN